MKSPLSIRDVYRASSLLDEGAAPSSILDLGSLRGQLTEFCADRGHAQITLAIDLISRVHRAGEPAAWIGSASSLFYPPDLADWNLDLSALAIIRLEESHKKARAADRLLRSGAFGVVIIDVANTKYPDLPSSHFGRLLQLAKNHDSAVVFLTRSAVDDPSISSLIATRARAGWSEADPYRLRAEITTIKARHHRPNRSFEEVYNGPMGLH